MEKWTLLHSGPLSHSPYSNVTFVHFPGGGSPEIETMSVNRTQLGHSYNFPKFTALNGMRSTSWPLITVDMYAFVSGWGEG